MLIFSAEQVKQLQLGNWDRMCKRISGHIWNNFRANAEAQGLNEKTLLTALYGILEDAKQRGFISERDLRVCGEGCAVLGIDFLQAPKFLQLQQAIDDADPGEPTARLVDEAMILAETAETYFA